jgi:hypothetical protein
MHPSNSFIRKICVHILESNLPHNKKKILQKYIASFQNPFLYKINDSSIDTFKNARAITIRKWMYVSIWSAAELRDINFVLYFDILLFCI